MVGVVVVTSVGWDVSGLAEVDDGDESAREGRDLLGLGILKSNTTCPLLPSTLFLGRFL